MATLASSPPPLLPPRTPSQNETIAAEIGARDGVDTQRHFLPGSRYGPGLNVPGQVAR